MRRRIGTTAPGYVGWRALHLRRWVRTSRAIPPSRSRTRPTWADEQARLCRDAPVILQRLIVRDSIA